MEPHGPQPISPLAVIGELELTRRHLEQELAVALSRIVELEHREHEREREREVANGRPD